jgi:hypothetical protein
MQRSKIMIQGHGIVTCLSQREALRRVKALNESEWVEKAYREDGYIGFNVATGDIDFHPGPTTVKLYEIPKKEGASLLDLQNHFRQNWQRIQHIIENRVKFFYSRNCLLY